jgi:hypothetical protein
MQPKRVLVVANQTSAGRSLRQEILRRAKQRPHVFTLVVPATAPKDHLVSTDEEADELARRHLEAALGALQGEGLEIEGHVGDPSPMLAIADALLTDTFEEIVLSTLPPGMSRWLKQDLPVRVERRFGLPLTVVIGEPTATTLS